MTAQGLPIGAQFVGRFGADATMLALAAEVEVHQPWASVRPTLR
jgi:amidase